MNGVHDMGGMHGMGPVEIEKNEPVFHSDWEARVHALNLACGFHRKWNIDMGRHSRERIPPAEYLAFSYYEKWLRGLEMLLVENGLVTPKELETCRAESKASGASVLRASEVAGFLRVRRLARMDDDVPATRYRPSPRPLPSRLPPLEYPGHVEIRRVSTTGAVSWRHTLFVSEALAGEHIAFEEVDDGIWTVRFATVVLGRFDERHHRIHPIAAFTVGRSPASPARA